MKINSKSPRLITDSELPGFCFEHHFGLGSVFLNENKEKALATFDLLVRESPKRNFLIAGGLEAIISFLNNLHYDDVIIKYLLRANRISQKFAEYLKNFSFSGDVYALPEGTVCFPGEPLLRVTAPIIEAHLITDQLIALANIDTLLLSKLARVRLAAKDIICSIGTVRAHGIDAGWRAARNSTFFKNMGFANITAALRLGFEASTAAFNANHAFIKSFDSEIEALRAAVRNFPDAISPMIDTYNSKQGIANAVKIADELKAMGKCLESVYIDSGDLLEEAKYARQKLDAAGHKKTKIVVASNLDEYKISKLISAGIPADKFAIVTEVVTSADAPKLEMVYKMAQIEDNGKIRYTAKFSPGKISLPGKKQVFRILKNSVIEKDVIGLENEKLGEPLLVPIFKKGKLVYKIPSTEEHKKYTMNQLSTLPEKLKNIFEDHKPPVEISREVSELLEVVKTQHSVEVDATKGIVKKFTPLNKK